MSPGVFVSRCNSTCMQIVLNSGILTNRVATGFQATVMASDKGNKSSPVNVISMKPCPVIKFSLPRNVTLSGATPLPSAQFCISERGPRLDRVHQTKRGDCIKGVLNRKNESIKQSKLVGKVYLIALHAPSRRRSVFTKAQKSLENETQGWSGTYDKYFM